jgi:hypothetical protein
MRVAGGIGCEINAWDLPWASTIHAEPWSASKLVIAINENGRHGRDDAESGSRRASVSTQAERKLILICSLQRAGFGAERTQETPVIWIRAAEARWVSIPRRGRARRATGRLCEAAGHGPP